MAGAIAAPGSRGQENAPSSSGNRVHRTKLVMANFVVATLPESRFFPLSMNPFLLTPFPASRVVALLLLTPAVLFAGPPPTESVPHKSHYHLFNPTPRAQMREMSTDRPDQTESPYTVDAGHVQVEM